MEDLWVAPAIGGEEPKKKPGKHYGRFRAVNAFVDSTLRDLPRVEAAVWLILWRDTKDGVARTGQTDLARRAGACTRSIGRAVKSLASKGLLKVLRRGTVEGGPSVYQVFGVKK